MTKLPLPTPDGTPWPVQTEATLPPVEMVDGEQVLADVETFVRKYCVLPSEAAYVAVTLWIAHTHAFEAWDTTPRLAVISAEKNSGKTRVLEILDLLCFDAELTMSMSSAYVFRRIEHGRPTLLVDETDALFSTGRGGKLDPSKEDLRALINSGYRKGAVVGRVEMQGKIAVPTQFHVFCPVALAGIKHLPDTVMSRSIVVWMQRRKDDEQVHSFRQRRVTKEAQPIKSDLRAWGLQNTEALGELMDGDLVEMPDLTTDRNEDIWEPLLAIAQHVGGTWAKRAEEAALAFVDAHEESNTTTVGAQLLRDIRAVFGDQEQVRTEWLLAMLWSDPDTMWNEQQLTSRKLANKLKVYGVSPGPLWFYEPDGSKRQLRGYKRADFEDAWSRYAD